ncbi:MAG: BREX-1 system phosphatase PglZ type B [Actinobacteria bacterium]|nr:BREX-1 system phosphatase PglZ type B [Actinomycetota bacterium]
MSTMLSAIVESLDHVAMGVGGDQAPPAVVLWPDGERLWESVIERFVGETVVLILGDYRSDRMSGPAYWLRAALGGALDVELGARTPVVYMPGISRDVFRAAEDCPVAIKPLVHLQYQGAFWSQPNGKDWTPTAFLQNREKGLGVDVAQGSETTQVLQATLAVLLDQPVMWIQQRQLITAKVLNDLVQPDPVSILLGWLDDPQSTKARLAAAEWGAFVSSSKADYKFDPTKDGEIHAAGLLGKKEGPWKLVWLRYRESPTRYPGIQTRLRAAGSAHQGTLAFDDEARLDHQDAWPQINEQQEDSLRKALAAIGQMHISEARERVGQLEREHGSRRHWIWADLGECPLANALKFLTLLVDDQIAAPAVSVSRLTDWYLGGGWKSDDAALRALGAVSDIPDVSAVSSALTILYSGWLDQAARQFHDAVEANPDSYMSPPPFDRDPGTCLLFTDGLRYDLGQRLADELRTRGMEVDVRWHLAALPTITSTAKPALAPVAGRFVGGDELGPRVLDGGPVTAPTLRKALMDGGYQVLDVTEVGDPSKRAWTEYGDVDKQGHNFGKRLADAADRELTHIAGRVEMLVAAGWKQVEIVTDHGFIVLPEKLRKVELPAHLVDKRKGRCARVTEGQVVDQPTVRWRWDPAVRFAVARGAACFEDGKEYEHGGLSPQECIVPHLIVSGVSTAEPTQVRGLTWAGLRLRIEVAGPGASMDLRTKAVDPASSLIGSPVGIADGKATAVVPEPDAEGQAAVVVVLSEDGRLLAQQATVVGDL